MGRGMSLPTLVLILGVGYLAWRASQGQTLLPPGVVMVGGTVDAGGCSSCGMPQAPVGSPQPAPTNSSPDDAGV